MSNYVGLETFIVVAEEMSITKAARRLRISKSVVSKRIKSLEEVTKATLFFRNNQDFYLTDTGHAFLRQARLAQLEVKKAFEGLIEDQSELTGTLRVTTPSAFGKKFVLDLVNDFLEKHEGLKIELRFDDQFIGLLENDLDFAFRLIPEPDQNLHQLPLMKTTRIFCASAAYIKKNGHPRRPEELSEHPFNCVSSLVTKGQLRFKKEGKISKIRIENLFSSNSLEAIYTRAIQGRGISVLPLYLTENDIQSGHLVQILKGWEPVTPFHQNISLVFLPDRQMQPKVRAFIEFCKKWFHRY